MSGLELKIMAEFGGSYLFDRGIGTTLDSIVPVTPELQVLDDRLQAWAAKYEVGVNEPGVPDPNFDWHAWHAEGIALARTLKAVLKDAATVTFVYGYEDPARPSRQTDNLVIE